MVGLLGLDASVSSVNLYLRIHLVFKNYNTVNILRTAKSSYSLDYMSFLTRIGSLYRFGAL